MEKPLLGLLVLSCTLCSLRGALYAYLDEDSQYDLVYELEVGEELQLTCKSPSEEIDFYMAGVLPKIANDSVHGDIFPGSHPIVTAVSEHRDDLQLGHVMFEKSLKLTVNVGLNGTALQCGARGFDSDAGRIVWAYSRAVLLRVEDDGGNSTSTAAPPYVDIRLVDHGERLRIGDKLHVECNSSSEHIAFCVVGASCDDSLPNGTKATVSDTLEYYSNGSGRTLYRRTLELSVVAELDNISLQCKAGEGVPAYTRAVLLQVEEDEISRATPTDLKSCTSPSETVKLNETNLSCSGLSLKYNLVTTLVLTSILIFSN